MARPDASDNRPPPAFDAGDMSGIPSVHPRGSCLCLNDLFWKFVEILGCPDRASLKLGLLGLKSLADDLGASGPQALSDLPGLEALLFPQEAQSNSSTSSSNRRNVPLFQALYMFVFFISREKGHKALSVAAAVQAWSLLLGDAKLSLLGPWCTFVQKHAQHGITEDTWQQALEFLSTVLPDFSNYDSLGAWPVLVDEFVDFSTSRFQEGGALTRCLDAPGEDKAEQDLMAMSPVRTEPSHEAQLMLGRTESGGATTQSWETRFLEPGRMRKNGSFWSPKSQAQSQTQLQHGIHTHIQSLELGVGHGPLDSLQLAKSSQHTSNTFSLKCDSAVPEGPHPPPQQYPQEQSLEQSLPFTTPSIGIGIGSRSGAGMVVSIGSRRQETSVLLGSGESQEQDFLRNTRDGSKCVVDGDTGGGSGWMLTRHCETPDPTRAANDGTGTLKRSGVQGGMESRGCGVDADPVLSTCPSFPGVDLPRPEQHRKGRESLSGAVLGGYSSTGDGRSGNSSFEAPSFGPWNSVQGAFAQDETEAEAEARVTAATEAPAASPAAAAAAAAAADVDGQKRLSSDWSCSMGGKKRRWEEQLSMASLGEVLLGDCMVTERVDFIIEKMAELKSPLTAKKMRVSDGEHANPFATGHTQA